MRKALSKTQDLPQYLGFGTLDSASVSTKAEKTTANYMLGNEVVYQVTIGKKNCEIVEFVENAQDKTGTQKRHCPCAI